MALNKKAMKSKAGAKAAKRKLLNRPIQHIDITKIPSVVPAVDAMHQMAFTARDLANAAKYYELMLRDKECGVILTLAGSLISAGLKKVIVDMVRHNMVDAIVSTGANIVDQDFFEALGFKHYVADDKYKSGMFDGELREMAIDRIYDTFIDEDELRICDETTQEIFDSLELRPHSSREIIEKMGEYLDENGGPKCEDSIVYECFKKQVPIFCPAFSDCSAGFGIVTHQAAREGEAMVTIDSGKDFHELTKLKIANPCTGIFMIGGGVPKNFTQDIVVCAEVLGHDAPMHKYAIQITIADVRDGALSSSTLKEASSWGKVDLAYEQMVFSEATVAMPLIVAYGYQKGAYKARKGRKWASLLEQPAMA